MAKKAATEGTSPEQTASESADKASGPKVKKTVLFDQAMQELGRDAKPVAIREWLLKNRGLDMKLTTVSTYKSNWLNKHRKKPGPKPGQKPTSAPAAKKGEATLDEIRHLKDLIGRMGEPRFRDLIDLLCL